MLVVTNDPYGKGAEFIRSIMLTLSRLPKVRRLTSRTVERGLVEVVVGHPSLALTPTLFCGIARSRNVHPHHAQ